VETYNATEFFQFPQFNSYPILDGYWILSRLELLLRHRGTLEKELIKRVSPEMAKTLTTQFGDTLPFFDPLEMSDCRRWRTFVDGRDALGRTLRYVAEIKAICRWLDELKRQYPTVPPGSSPPPAAQVLPLRSNLIGVWTGTISTQRDWKFLQLSGLPLYSLFKLDSDHPLCQYLGLGWLDNDEQYRLDPVDVKVDPTGRSPMKYYPKETRANGVYPVANPMPLPDPWRQLRDRSEFADPGGRIRCDSSVDPLLPFTSYIYLDPLSIAIGLLMIDGRRRPIKPTGERLISSVE